MSERRIRRLLFAIVGVFTVLSSFRQATAGDCFRQLGIGYSAGYHAPAPFVQPSSCSKWTGWLHWKSACCQPGSAGAGCGCQPVAPSCGCGPAIAPCGPASCLPRGCGPCLNCGPQHPAIY